MEICYTLKSGGCYSKIRGFLLQNRGLLLWKQGFLNSLDSTLQIRFILHSEIASLHSEIPSLRSEIWSSYFDISVNLLIYYVKYLTIR